MRKNLKVININNKYFLRYKNKAFRCQIGSGGLEKAAKKKEGDKKTPIGKWYLRKIFYRSDRVLRPKFKKNNSLKISKITKNCGWCDDINSNNYNRYIKTDVCRSLGVNFEKLWRKDEAYDIIIVISYNVKPTIKNKGSAIFIHCSFSDNRNTAGCVALKKKHLIFLINYLHYNMQIKI